MLHVNYAEWWEGTAECPEPGADARALGEVARYGDFPQRWLMHHLWAWNRGLAGRLLATDAEYRAVDLARVTAGN